MAFRVGVTAEEIARLTGHAAAGDVAMEAIRLLSKGYAVAVPILGRSDGTAVLFGPLDAHGKPAGWTQLVCLDDDPPLTARVTWDDRLQL